MLRPRHGFAERLYWLCWLWQAQARGQDIRDQQAFAARVAAVASAIGVSQDDMMARVAVCLSSGDSVDAMLESVESAAAAGLRGADIFA